MCIIYHILVWCKFSDEGKPHQEFVKSLCSYKDIFELRNRVEAFALQYEMHASSYQRDCILDWTLDSASGYYYNQTNGLHYKLDSRFNYSDSIVSATLSAGRRELYALFVEETLDLRSIHSVVIFYNEDDISWIRHEFDLAKQKFLNTPKALINMPKMQFSRFAID
ncbi:unnamed protein product [Brassica oleracea var. botrytis]